MCFVCTEPLLRFYNLLVELVQSYLQMGQHHQYERSSQVIRTRCQCSLRLRTSGRNHSPKGESSNSRMRSRKTEILKVEDICPSLLYPRAMQNASARRICCSRGWKSRLSYVPLTGNFQTLVGNRDEDFDVCMDE